jgi:hypothetical protein
MEEATKSVMAARTMRTSWSEVKKNGVLPLISKERFLLKKGQL